MARELEVNTLYCGRKRKPSRKTFAFSTPHSRSRRDDKSGREQTVYEKFLCLLGRGAGEVRAVEEY